MGRGDRLPSGVRGLDTVLNGGFPRNNLNLITGAPGSGKTVLVQQVVFANAAADGPAVVFSTVSEPLERMLSHAQTLGFFRRQAVGESILYHNLGPTLAEKGLAAAEAEMADVLNRHLPGLVVVDSLRPLRAFAGDDERYVAFLFRLASRLAAFSTDAFWVAEHPEDAVDEAPEAAIADTVLVLSRGEFHSREFRALRVAKLRGSGFLSARHAVRITADGLEVLPRLNVLPLPAANGPLDEGRASTGLPLMDELLGGGFWRGSATLLTGPPGSGKTLTALAFLSAGAAAGEAGIVSLLHERPETVQRRLGELQAPPGRVTVLESGPELQLEEWSTALLAAVDRTGARRVAIGELSDLRAAALDDVRFQSWLQALLAHLARRGVTVLVGEHTDQLHHPSALTAGGAARLFDNLILLHHLHDGAATGRILLVKVQGTDAARQKDYRVTGGGLGLQEPDEGRR